MGSGELKLYPRSEHTGAKQHEQVLRVLRLLSALRYQKPAERLICAHRQGHVVLPSLMRAAHNNYHPRSRNPVVEHVKQRASLSVWKCLEYVQRDGSCTHI